MSSIVNIMTVAIIPARGGSKRIPRKNIKFMAGKPAISFPILGSLNSNLFDRVIVPTDDAEIAEISKFYGAEVPFLRKPELSADLTGTVQVITNSLEYLAKFNFNVDYACCIYPVTPLLDFERVRDAFQIIKRESWDYVFAVSEFSTPIERAFRKNKNDEIEFLSPEFVNVRTQDIPESFRDTVQFYWEATKAWTARKQILNSYSMFIELSEEQFVDVDELKDWELVENLLSNRAREGK